MLGAALSAHPLTHMKLATPSSSRAEPILARIQEDRTVIISPVFDNIHFDTFVLEKYDLAVDGFNWELWCRYDALPQAWLALHDTTAPVKYVSGGSGNLVSTRGGRNELRRFCFSLVVVIGVGWKGVEEMESGTSNRGKNPIS